MSDWGEDEYVQTKSEAEIVLLPVEDEDQPPPLHFGSVDEFIRDYLRNVYRRRIDGRHRYWAAEWWRYDEAVIRLEALWRAWEHLRLDPALGMSIWWRDHADHHMPILMSEDGPFASAPETPENRCKLGEPLPYKSPPREIFPDLRKTDIQTST